MNIRRDVGLGYDDVLLVPKKGILDSREDADIGTNLTSNTLELLVPIVSAPMSSVTEYEMAIAMANLGGFGFIHRFMTIEEQVEQFRRIFDPDETSTWYRAGAAIGINEGMDRVDALSENGVRVFCLDVAHAHSDKVGEFMDDFWRHVGPTSSRFNDVAFDLVVGNVATAEGAEFLVEHGANAVKVGIGPGAACTTREVTGFGVPQLTAIMEVAEAVDVPIIADGGIKNSGDILKALAAGADAVMLGRLLAGSDEAPHPGEYFGMASARVNGHKAPEGVEGMVEPTGPVKDTIKKLAWGIKSGISYAGAADLEGLRMNAEFRVNAHGVAIESGVRI